MNQDVSELIDPTKFRDNLNIEGIEKSLLIDMLRKMILIRKAEEKLSENIETGKIKCPCHLGIGQEAIGVAVALVMRKTDRAFGAHRSHAHFLALLKARRAPDHHTLLSSASSSSAHFFFGRAPTEYFRFRFSYFQNSRAPPLACLHHIF